ncbi:MAG TPA: hypothetical protein VFR37_09470, partial [Longimicrobium sp.]|nr:hypothetical protein [Longimicrobium sp.]
HMAEIPSLPQPPETVATIRDFARRRVEETSLRKVARQVGMSPSGLAKFIAGSAPYRRTIGRLESWYVVEREAAEPGPTDAEVLATAVRVLARMVPPTSRNGLVDEILDSVRRRLPVGRTLPEGLVLYERYMRFAE